MSSNLTRAFTLSSIFTLAACSGGSGRPGESNSDSNSTGGIMTVGGTATGGTATGGATMGGTATDGQTDTGTASGGSSGGPKCGEANVQPMAVPPNVMLVLDASGSMVSNEWDADANPMTPDVTRWESLHNVVAFITSNFDAQINFGAQRFPAANAQASYGAAACVVSNTPEVPVAPMNGAALVAALPPANAGTSQIKGATPAAAGVTSAVAHLKTLDPGIERFVILVTDGAANCGGNTSQEMMEVYDKNLQQVVGDAFTNDNISTFVIGIDMQDKIVGCTSNCGECSNNPNTICSLDSECGAGNDCLPMMGKCSMTTSEYCASDAGCPMGETCVAQPIEVDGSPLANPWDELNEVATLGGVPKNGGMDPEKFYNAANEIELQAALESIAGAVISCTIPLDPAPMANQENYVEIEIDGMKWPKVMDCNTEDGWMFTKPDLSEIQLCGAACQGFQDAGGALDAKYGCPPAG